MLRRSESLGKEQGKFPLNEEVDSSATEGQEGNK